LLTDACGFFDEKAFEKIAVIVFSSMKNKMKNKTFKCRLSLKVSVLGSLDI